MSTALYRRYRPETFADVIGQEHVTEPLMQALRTGRVNHAYLFSGPRGCGKTTSARILARCLNCEQGPTPTPCGECESCVALSRDGAGSVDVIEIDAASHGGVDDARDLRERAAYGPAQSRFKIYIIDEAHMVTQQGFNALLKIVEEPPEHVKFIFATTEPDKVLGTIRSRTHHYPFRLVPPARLSEYMQQLCDAEGVQVAAGVLGFVTRAGGGSVRDSLSVLDQLIAGSSEEGLTYAGAAALLGFTDVALLDATVDALAAGDSAGVFKQVDHVVESGQDPRRFVEDLLERLRDLIVVSAVEDGAERVLRGLPSDQIDRMRAQAGAFGRAGLTHTADVINHGLTEMQGATSPRLQLELMLARALLPRAAGEDGYGARLDRIERRLDVAADLTPGRMPVAQPAASMPAPAPAAAQQAPVQQPQHATEEAPVSNEQSDGAQPVQADGPQGDHARAPEPPVDRPRRRPDVPVDPHAPEPPDDDVPPEPEDSGQAEPVAPPPGRSASGWGAPAESPQESQRAGEPSDEQVPAPGRSASGWGAAPQAAAPTERGSEPEPQRREQPAERPQEPSGHSAGRLDIADVRREWPQILQRVAKARRVTWALVSQHAHPASFDGRTLVLTSESPGLVQRIASDPNPEVVRRAVQDTLGVDVRVVAQQAGAQDAPAASGEEQSAPSGWGPAAERPKANPQRDADAEQARLRSRWQQRIQSHGGQVPQSRSSDSADAQALAAQASMSRYERDDSSGDWSSNSDDAPDWATAQFTPPEPQEAAPSEQQAAPRQPAGQYSGDDGQESLDDETVEDAGEVGLPVMSAVLGAVVIEDKRD